MIPHKMSTDEFLIHVNNFNKCESWIEKDITVDVVKKLISDNWPNVQACMENNSHMEQLNDLSERIKKEFPDDEAAEEFANKIQGYIATKFFSHSDVVKEILHHVTPENPGQSHYKRELGNMALVSKAFHDAVEKRKMRWAQENLVSLKILGGGETADKAIEYISENKLKKVNLLDYPDFDNANLKKLMEKCPYITSLAIDGDKIDTWPEMNSLTYLSLQTSEKTANSNLMNVAGKCPNLQVISLHEDSGGLRWISFSKPLTLDEGIEKLAKNCPNLLEVDLSTNHVGNSGIKALVEHCPNLKIIGPLKQVDNEGLNCIAQSQLKLEQIDFNFNKLIKDGIEPLVKNCGKNFKHLNFSGTNISDAEVKIIAENCPNLEVLMLRQNPNISDASVKHIALNCPHLKQLHLTNTNVGDLNISELCTRCPDMKRIRVDDTKVTNVGVVAMANGWPHLQEIYLAYCKIDNEAVEALTKSCHDLEKVTLDKTRVRDHILLGNLANRCLNLQLISIGQNDLPDDKVNLLKMKFPNVKFIC